MALTNARILEYTQSHTYMLKDGFHDLIVIIRIVEKQSYYIR